MNQQYLGDEENRLAVEEARIFTEVDPTAEGLRLRTAAATAVICQTMAPEHWNIVIEDLEALGRGIVGQAGLNALSRAVIRLSERVSAGEWRGTLDLRPELAEIYLSNPAACPDTECTGCGLRLPTDRTAGMVLITFCPRCGSATAS